ncbi:hypothetical protein VTO42DRAFT_5219 [Malbranchea cinnamomea]
MASPDYSSIIHSPTFTFLVGPEHTKLTIQSGLARHVSQPLDELMNSGLTRESRHHIAVLEEEDVETFVGFCEFAYTGDYRVPVRRTPIAHSRKGSQGITIPPPAPSPPATPGLEAQGDSAENAENPDDAAAGGEGVQGEGKKGRKSKKKTQSIDEGAAALTPPTTPPPEGAADAAGEPATSGGADWYDVEPQKQEPSSEESQQPPLFAAPGSKGGNLWSEFTSIQYPRLQRRTFFPAPISQGPTTNPFAPGDVPYVLFHAKLYRFSTRFLIPSLAQLCLTKLHQDLLRFPLDSENAEDNAPIILELLHFTFNNTKRNDPVFSLTGPSPYAAHSENQLRKLVVHYAACKIHELASYKPPIREPPSPTSAVPGVKNVVPPTYNDLRELLDITGELASDLVFRLM